MKKYTPFLIINLILSVAIIFNLSGCNYKRKKIKYKKHINKNNKSKFIYNYKLNLTGIECSFCARLALELLERIPGVKRAEFVGTDITGINGYINLIFESSQKNNFNKLYINNIRQVLNSDSFDLAYIEGPLFGYFDYGPSVNNLRFNVLGLNNKVQENFLILKSDLNKFDYKINKKPIHIQAKIKFIPSLKQYRLISVN